MLLYGRKMARNEQDPAANTQQFRAFAKGGETASTAKGPNTTMIITAIVGAVVVIAVVAFLLLS